MGKVPIVAKFAKGKESSSIAGALCGQADKCFDFDDVLISAEAATDGS